MYNAVLLIKQVYKGQWCMNPFGGMSPLVLLLNAGFIEIITIQLGELLDSCVNELTTYVSHQKC